MLPAEQDKNIETEAPKSQHNCELCGKKFKKKLLFFDDKKTCFICYHSVCENCISKEERYYPDLKTRGFSCTTCYPRTTAVLDEPTPSRINNLLPPGPDINSAIDSIEKRIPQHLQNISDRLDTVERVEGVLENLIMVLKEQVKDVKLFSQGFTQHNWSIIRKDIYKILFFAALGIIILCAIMVLQVMLLVKYVYPLI